MASNDTQNKACPNKCYWINQGLIYALIVLITMISTISFLKLLKFGTGDPSFVSMFEFGATLSSIILSVVAIVFTLIQSKQSETVTAKVIDASEMVGEHSEILKSSVTQMENQVNLFKELNLEKTLKEHMERFDDRLASLGQVMTEKFEEVACSLSVVDKLFDEANREITENDKTVALNCVKSMLKETKHVMFTKILQYVLLKVYSANTEGITVASLYEYFNELSDGFTLIYPKIKLDRSTIHQIIGMHYMNVLIGLVSKDCMLNIEKEQLIKIIGDFKKALNKEKFNELDKHIETTLKNWYKSCEKKLPVATW